MKKFSAVLFILTSGYFQVSYGMDNNEDNRLQQQNEQLLAEVRNPNNNAPMAEARNPENNVATTMINLTIEQERFPHLNHNGIAILEEQVNEAYRSLSKWQLERIRHYAAHGQFDAYKNLIKFWRVVEGGAFPLSEFFQLVTAALPLLSIFNGDKFGTGLKILTALSGILGLFFGRISDFAGQRIAEETEISDILIVLRNEQLVRNPILDNIVPNQDNSDSSLDEDPENVHEA